MLGVKQYLARQNQKEEIPQVKVLVASAPIKQGVPLDRAEHTVHYGAERNLPRGCGDGSGTDQRTFVEGAAGRGRLD